MANIRESCVIASPSGVEEECAKFVIDDISTPFVLHDVIETVGKEHIFSLWVRSEATGSIISCGSEFQSTAAWSDRYVTTFTADSNDILLTFGTVGTYYIYHPQLEMGNRHTDWAPSPADMRDYIDYQILATKELIRNVITGPNGTSVMTQNDKGWTFNIAEYKDEDVSKQLGSLDKRITDAEELGNYVTIGSYEGDTCIELGQRAEGKDAKLRITNTQIQFVQGEVVPAYIANQNGVSKLMIQKAEVTGELQLGNFIWQKRDNGNVGLQWIGGNS